MSTLKLMGKKRNLFLNKKFVTSAFLSLFSFLGIFTFNACGTTLDEVEVPTDANITLTTMAVPESGTPADYADDINVINNIYIAQGLITSNNFSSYTTGYTIANVVGGVKQSIYAERIVNNNACYKKNLSHSSFVKVGTEYYIEANNYIVRKASNISSLTDYSFADGKTSKITQQNFINLYGATPNTISSYIINDDTILNCKYDGVVDGLHKFTYELEPTLSTINSRNEMKTMANSSKFPVISKVTLSIYLNDGWKVYKTESYSEYKVEMNPLGVVSCTENLTEYFTFESKQIPNQAYFKEMCNFSNISEITTEPSATDKLLVAFKPYLYDGKPLNLSITSDILGDENLDATIYIDIDNIQYLSAIFKLDKLNIKYENGNIYLNADNYYTLLNLQENKNALAQIFNALNISLPELSNIDITGLIADMQIDTIDDNTIKIALNTDLFNTIVNVDITINTSTNYIAGNIVFGDISLNIKSSDTCLTYTTEQEHTKINLSDITNFLTATDFNIVANGFIKDDRNILNSNNDGYTNQTLYYTVDATVNKNTKDLKLAGTITLSTLTQYFDINEILLETSAFATYSINFIINGNKLYISYDGLEFVIDINNLNEIFNNITLPTNNNISDILTAISPKLSNLIATIKQTTINTNTNLTDILNILVSAKNDNGSLITSINLSKIINSLQKNLMLKVSASLNEISLTTIQPISAYNILLNLDVAIKTVNPSTAKEIYTISEEILQLNNYINGTKPINFNVYLSDLNLDANITLYFDINNLSELKISATIGNNITLCYYKDDLYLTLDKFYGKLNIKDNLPIIKEQLQKYNIDDSILNINFNDINLNDVLSSLKIDKGDKGTSLSLSLPLGVNNINVIIFNNNGTLSTNVKINSFVVNASLSNNTINYDTNILHKKIELSKILPYINAENLNIYATGTIKKPNEPLESGNITYNSISYDLQATTNLNINNLKLRVICSIVINNYTSTYQNYEIIETTSNSSKTHKLDIYYDNGEVYFSYNDKLNGNFNTNTLSGSIDAINELLEYIPELKDLLDNLTNNLGINSDIKTWDIPNLINKAEPNEDGSTYFNLNLTSICSLLSDNLGIDLYIDNSLITLKTNPYLYFNGYNLVADAVITSLDNNSVAEIYASDSSKSYINFNSISQLIKTLANTAKMRHFYLTGIATIDATIVKVSVNLDIKIDINDNGQISLVGTISHSGSTGFEHNDCITTIYKPYSTTDIHYSKYFYEKSGFLGLTKVYKTTYGYITQDDISSDLLNIIYELLDLSSTITNLMQDLTIDTSNIKYEELLNSYNYDDNTNTYALGLNLSSIDSNLGATVVTITHTNDNKLSDLKLTLKIIKILDLTVTGKLMDYNNEDYNTNQTSTEFITTNSSSFVHYTQL